MSASKPDHDPARRKKTSRALPKHLRTYRGVRLQSMADRSRYSIEEVEAAIRAAIAKNPDVFSKER